MLALNQASAPSGFSQLGDTGLDPLKQRVDRTVYSRHRRAPLDVLEHKLEHGSHPRALLDGPKSTGRVINLGCEEAGATEERPNRATNKKGQTVWLCRDCAEDYDRQEAEEDADRAENERAEGVLP